MPAMRALPASGSRKPVSIFMVVDLPAPLGPRKPSTSPCRTRSEMPSTAMIVAEAFPQIGSLDQDRHQLHSPVWCGPQPHIFLKRPARGR